MKPYYQDEWVTQYCSDALTILRGLESDSIDLLCTDPPYGIGFMGKDWDKALPDKQIWAECLRVLKPGSFAFVMSIPRSDCLSRMIISLEDAGFRTNFTPIYWAYASGFPKAQNIGKAVDKRNGRIAEEYKALGKYLKAQRGNRPQKDISQFFPSKTGGLTGCVANWELGFNVPTKEQWVILKRELNLDKRFDELIEREEAEREVVGKGEAGLGKNSPAHNGGFKPDYNLTKSSTLQAKALDGSYGGFQPKPAVEVIIVAMKPLSEKTFVDQALKNRKGITWLDSVRIPASSGDNAFDALLKACDSIQDYAPPTILCNKNYINHVHHVGDSDYTLGRELNLWLSFCQDGEAGSEKHWNEVLSSQYDYPAYRHLYGELVLLSKVGDQDIAPSQADVLAGIRQFALSHKHSQCYQYNDPLSICGGLFHILAVLALVDNWAFTTSLFTLYYNYTSNASSRFPANLIVSDDVLNDGRVTKGSHNQIRLTHNRNINVYGKGLVDQPIGTELQGIGDSGSFSRYFDLDSWAKTFPFLIVPKASKSEKNKGLGDIEPQQVTDGRSIPPDYPSQRGQTIRHNLHPTVKPLKLMSYLITLGSREDNVVLDPFLGSGTTALACKLLNRKCIGIEIEEKYCEIAAKRCSQGVFNFNSRIGDEEIPNNIC